MKAHRQTELTAVTLKHSHIRLRSSVRLGPFHQTHPRLCSGVGEYAAFKGDRERRDNVHILVSVQE